MFAWWGRVVVRVRWWLLAASAVLVLVGAGWGAGVFGALSSGGFDDPASESSRAAARITAALGNQNQDVIALYTNSDATVDDPQLRQPVQTVLDTLTGRPEIAQIVSYYRTGSPAFVSTDRHATYVAIQLRDGDETAKLADLETLRPLLTADGVQTEIGGSFAFLDDANKQIESDIVRAEVLSLPIVLVLMILVFRGLVAATMPLLVGVIAILGAFTVTRLLAQVVDVSVFAANVITMLGLGMAVDYALFIVSRFREELDAGHPTQEAIRRTITTAGRTVVVSGLTVALALSSLLLFPMDFLKSMAYGGMAAVLVAMLAALTALPALLAVLGPRINALRDPLPRRRRAGGATPSTTTMADARTPGARTVGTQNPSAPNGGWARLAGSVMRRPLLYLVGVAIILFALATPFLSASFGGFDERVLPVGTPSRTVTERIANEFPGNDSPIYAVITGTTAADAQAYAQRIGELPGATGAQVTASKGTVALVTVTYNGTASAPSARELVKEIRATPKPAGAQVLVGGIPAGNLDQIDSLTRRLPWMAVYVAAVTFVLLFLAFGSVVLPVKAFVMNVISIGASFGVVVWIFQEGHLSSWLGFTPTGSVEPTNLILMLAILFGLSTDYEIFLLSRIREEWDQRGDNTSAVTAGLQRTGGIITAAAILLIVVIGGFATGGSTTIKMLGIGTVVAVAVDAALVRTLLVPATMRLLGRWNWWSPGPLARFYRRYGIHESAPAMTAAMTPAPSPEPVEVHR
jgi:uncharacterized membrane protein YdfJ with MMPL/SSD domain